jgi:glutaminyl-tRNA synthetase
MDYLLSNPLGDVDIKAFEESCGVGIVVTPEQIELEVEKVIKKYHTELVEKRSVLP